MIEFVIELTNAPGSVRIDRSKMKPTQTDYIILAYMRESPLHGYRLVEKMQEEKLDIIASFSVPNIYAALRKLYKNGLIDMEIKRSESRPDQKIYSLTDEGRAHLDGFFKDESVFSQEIRFTSDLVFLLSEKLGMDASAAADSLEKRLDQLMNSLTSVQDALKELQAAAAGSELATEAAFQHQIRFLKHEIDFYRKLIKDLK